MKLIGLLLISPLLLSTPNAAEKSQLQMLDENIQKLITDSEASSYSPGKLTKTETTPWDKRIESPNKFRQEQRKVRKDRKFARVANERFISSIEDQIKSKLENFLIKNQASLGKNILKGSSFDRWDRNYELDSIKVSLSYGKGLVDAKTAKPSQMKDLTSIFHTLEVKSFEFKVLNAWSEASLNLKEDSEEGLVEAITQSEKLQFLIGYDIRGQQKSDKHKAHLSGELEIEVTRGKDWSDSRLTGFGNVSSVYRVLNRAPSFKDVTQNMAVSKGKIYKRREALRRGGYALSTGDFNNDGIPDLFVGNAGKASLWQGLPSGDFKEIKSDVSNATLVKAAAFVDLNNNGYKDLVLTRFDNTNLEGDILVYENKKGEFKLVQDAFNSKHLRLYAMPMAIADFNNDGLNDIYVGFPGEKDFSMSTYDLASSTNHSGKYIHGVYFNKGNLKFDDVTNEAFPDHSRYHTFPHGSVASDIDNDGDMDIVIMDDQKNLSPILIGDGKGKFSIANQELNISNFGYGMGVTVGDINNDGAPDVLMSNATFHTEKRIQQIGKRFGRKSFASEAGATQALRLFQGVPGKGNFYESTLSSGLTDLGEGVGGVSLIDYDNDGNEDIFVVNGLWSGTSDKSIDSLFAQAQHLGLTDITHLHDGEGEARAPETQSLYMKALIETEVKTKSGTQSLSFGGKQRNRLFKNFGNGMFIDVAYLEGVDSVNDGYMSAIADINGDGKLDLLLRNCDPGPNDLSFPVVELFQNNHKNSNSVRLSLVGTRSNKDAIGTKVIAKFKDKKINKELIANNSATQSELTIHIGLGDEQSIQDLYILWPSGKKEHLKNVSMGEHKIIEGNSKLVSKN